MLESVHGPGEEHPFPLLLWPQWDHSRTGSSAGKAGGQGGMADAVAPVLLPTPGRSRACPGRFPRASSPESVSALLLWAASSEVASGGFLLLTRSIIPWHCHCASAVFEKEEGRSHQHPFSPVAICTSMCSSLWGEFRKNHICT